MSIVKDLYCIAQHLTIIENRRPLLCRMCSSLINQTKIWVTKKKRIANFCVWMMLANIYRTNVCTLTHKNTVTTKIEYNADTQVYDADDDCILQKLNLWVYIFMYLCVSMDDHHDAFVKCIHLLDTLLKNLIKSSYSKHHIINIPYFNFQQVVEPVKKTST